MKIRFRIHPAGCGMLALAFLLSDSHTVVSVIIALFLHEGAHLAAMAICGVRRCSVELTPFGGVADAEEMMLLPPFRQLCIALAGVVCSAVCAWLCWKWGNTSLFFQTLFTANASLAFVNCLPLWPLDGARVVLAVSGRWEKTFQKLLAALAWMVGAVFVGAALYGAWNGYFNLTLLLAGPYLCYASRQGLISEQIRKISIADQKLTFNDVMYTDVLATRQVTEPSEIAKLLGQLSSSRYHLLCEVDPQNGTIKKIWTETELLSKTAKFDTFGNDTQVDNRSAL